jgi:hypothetical protein
MFRVFFAHHQEPYGRRTPETCRPTLLIKNIKSCISLDINKISISSDARSHEYKNICLFVSLALQPIVVVFSTTR